MIHKSIPSRDRLIFAMDVPDCERAKELATQLGDAVTFYKIGLELMMSGRYFELLDWLLERDKKVFCDLKFFDIPATVGAAVRQLKDRGAAFVTVHGNRSIMEAAAENKGDSLKVLGVTVLTSLDRGDLDDLGFDCDLQALVLSRAKQALDAGCDGVISSGLEVPLLRQHLDDKLIVISPGIRPVDNKPAGRRTPLTPKLRRRRTQQSASRRNTTLAYSFPCRLVIDSMCVALAAQSLGEQIPCQGREAPRSVGMVIGSAPLWII